MSSCDQWRLFPPTNYRSKVVVLWLTVGKDSHGIVKPLHDFFRRERHAGPHDLAKASGPELGAGGVLSFEESIGDHEDDIPRHGANSAPHGVPPAGQDTKG